nr:pecanex-like protein 1 [Lytechinus pictus]
MFAKPIEDSDAIEMVELNSNRPNYHSGTSSRTRSRTASSNKSTKVNVDGASANGNIEVEVHSQRKDLSAWEETLLQALNAIERGHRDDSHTSDDGLDSNDQSLSDDSKPQGAGGGSDTPSITIDDGVRSRCVTTSFLESCEEADAPWKDMDSSNDIRDRARLKSSKGKSSAKSGKHRTKSSGISKSVSSQGVSTSTPADDEDSKDLSKLKDRNKRTSCRSLESDPWVMRADELAWEDELAIMDQIFAPMKVVKGEESGDESAKKSDDEEEEEEEESVEKPPATKKSDLEKVVDVKKTKWSRSVNPRRSSGGTRVGPRIISVGPPSGSSSVDSAKADEVACGSGAKPKKHGEKSERKRNLSTVPISPLEVKDERSSRKSRHASAPSSSAGNFKRESSKEQKRKTKEKNKPHEGYISTADRLNNNNEVHVKGTHTKEPKKPLSASFSEGSSCEPLACFGIDDSEISGQSGSSNTLTPEHRLRSHSLSSSLSSGSDDSTVISERSAFLGSSATPSTRSTSSSTGLQWLFGLEGESPMQLSSQGSSPTSFRCQPGPSEEAASTCSFDARGSDRSQDRTREGAIPKRRAIVERSTSEESARYDEPYVAPDGTVVSNHLLSKMMRRMLREESIRSQLEGAVNPNFRRRRRWQARYVSSTSESRQRVRNSRSTFHGSTAAEDETRQRHASGEKSRRHNSDSTEMVGSRAMIPNSSPHNAALTMLSRAEGRYLATNHNDTSPGSVHCFQDEHGNWMTYTFSDNSSGIAQRVEADQNQSPEASPSPPKESTSNEWEETSSCHSDSTVISVPKPRPPPRALRAISSTSAGGTSVGGGAGVASSGIDLDLPTNILDRLTDPHQWEATLTGLFDAYPNMDSSSTYEEMHSMESRSAVAARATGRWIRNRDNKVKVLHNYRFWVLPWRSIRVSFDRLAFLALFDRNRTVVESVFAVLLAVLVSLFGFAVMTQGFLYDFWLFWFCLIVASCQYSLIKSVQPDAASPMHGHNPVIAYSRPLYFCLCCSLILLLDHLSSTLPHRNRTLFELYNFTFTTLELLIFARDLLLVFILFFPLVFLVGLLPQCNTFVMYLLETADIHIFGGSGTTGLGAAAYSTFRSIIAVLVLCGFAYGGLQDEEASSQHVLFSVFCGLAVAVSYHLSRSASNPGVVWSIIKEHVMPEDHRGNTEETEEEQIRDPLPDKLKKSVSERLQSDLIVCLVMLAFVTALHVSTVFTELMPALSYVLFIIAVVVGFLLHYILPQLRKELPFACFSQPLLKSREYHQFEVRVEVALK